jgi:cytidine deaminase
MRLSRSVKWPPNAYSPPAILALRPAGAGSGNRTSQARRVRRARTPCRAGARGNIRHVRATARSGSARWAANRLRRVIAAEGPVEEDTWKALLAAADAARQHAYAPYSRFQVGAAVLTDGGDVIAGSNVENASYGLTLCAERVAILTAVAAGTRRIRALFISTDVPATPCGACRQVLAEFGGDSVVSFLTEGGRRRVPLAELLPGAFSIDGPV